MKKLLLLPFAILLSNCACKKITSSESKKFSDFEITSQCPEDGKCKIELLKNKSLNVLTDDFGRNYYKLIDNSETSVIEYQYSRNIPEGLMDAGHTESILFEIKNDAAELKLENMQLQTVKMIFGRICFCRGQTGYYKVTNGTLNYMKTKNEYTIDLNFKITEVPQLYDKITAVIK